jgi:hypothetical protein
MRALYDLQPLANALAVVFFGVIVCLAVLVIGEVMGLAP